MQLNPYFQEEHQLLREQVRRFVEKEIVPNGDAWEQDGCVPRALLLKMGELGFLGLTHETAYGGSGLDVRAAGKSSEYDFVLGPDDLLTWRNQRHSNSGLTALWERNNISWREITDARQACATNLGLPTRTVPDFCEMGVVVNASGFTPDRPEFHTPILRPTELAEAFKRSAEGGLLAGDRRIDVFNCLRRADEASFAGGVFILVNSHDDKTWELLRDKGHIVAEDSGVAVLYNPQHLLGIEAPITILAAGLLGIPTGATDPKPVVDLVARTDRDFAAGERLTITDAHHHEVSGLNPELIPAVRFAAAHRHTAQAPRRRSPARCLSTSRAAHRAARSRCDRANASFAASVRRRSCSRARSSRTSSAAADRSRAAASCSARERSRLRAACVASIFCRRVGGAGGSS